MTKTFSLRPIGFVRASRAEAIDDNWDAESCAIELDETVCPASALQGLDAFSHAEVIFLFDKVDEAKITYETRRPRGNPAWPEIGIFAQRGKARPNRLGATVARIKGVRGARLELEGLDAIDGTPVLDIKPVMSGFLPRGAFHEPDWAKELMKDYW